MRAFEKFTLYEPVKVTYSAGTAETERSSMDERVHIPIGTGDHLIEAMIDAVRRDDVEVGIKISHRGMDISVTSCTEPRTRVTRRLIVKDFECANAMLASMRKDLEHCAGTKGDDDE